jgi:uncharacterized protein YqeY
MLARMTDQTAQPLKARLQEDLTASMRARDEVRTATLRMTLTAVTNEEVSGDSARQLSDDEVTAVLVREAKKRRESADVYDGAGRAELADRERAELSVLEGYLPTAMSDEELERIVAAAVDQARAGGVEGPRAIGVVMGIVRPQVGASAEGGRVAAAVRRQLDPKATGG